MVYKRLGERNENQVDLFQMGCIGIKKAENNYSNELDVKFSP